MIAIFLTILFNSIMLTPEPWDDTVTIYLRISDSLNNKAHLSQEELTAFLGSVPKDTDVELSQMWNELLFEILIQYPMETVETISTLKFDQKRNIFRELQTPVADNIDIDGTYESVKSILPKRRCVVNRICHSLNIAKLKLN